MAVTDINPGLLPIEQLRKKSPFHQFNRDILARYSEDIPPTNGRFRDVYLAADMRAEDTGSFTVYFITGTTTKPITVPDTVFIDGVQTYVELKIGANVKVMMRCDKPPPDEHW